MLVGVLTALGVLGAIGLLVVLFLQRGRDGMDLSLGGLLRVHLYAQDRLLVLLRLEPLAHLGARAVTLDVAEIGVQPVA